jgi:protein-export membrane protein SecD
MLYFGKFKIFGILCVCLLGLMFALPNALPPSVRDHMPAFLPQKGLNLGLDLQGGSYLLLEVDTDALKDERLIALLDDTRVKLRAENIVFSGLSVTKTGLTVHIPDAARLSAAKTALDALATRVQTSGKLGGATVKDLIVTAGPDQTLVITLNEPALEAVRRQAVEQSIEIVRRRIDALGTREPVIQRQGTDRIIVQVPGESNPERLKAVIGKTAKLTFQMVDDSVSAQEAEMGRVPPGSVLLVSENETEPKVLVRRRVLVSGDMLADAQPGFDQRTNEPLVSFRFDGKGARRFAEATGEGVGKRFAIVLDNKVISAPVIREPITGGQGQISGNFTIESANDLAVLLRAGALPAPLKIEEQRAVGAELGADAVRGGVLASSIGIGAVMVFMLLVYRGYGLIANMALIVNLTLLVGVLSMLQATLTLPGIAGIILTVGMAVDGNVLIFERIREELRKGQSPIGAIETGYAKTWWTIVDANVTALISTLILFNLGAGPVRGFAVTLALGVFTSVFTSFVVSRFMMSIWWRAARPKSMNL